MKRITLLKQFKAVVAVVAIVIAGVLLASGAQAWGPENRPVYTNESPAPYATFNSITT